MKKLVYVVEDDQFIRSGLTDALEMEEYRVHSFSNAKSAIERMSNGAELPKVIILDLRMPKMNGYEFLDEVAKYERLKSIPVLVVSADKLAPETFRKSQVKRVLAKPLDLSTLLDAVAWY